VNIPIPGFTEAESAIEQHGAKLAMPVTYYSRLMTVAYGGTAKEAGLDGHLIEPAPLQRIAAKRVK
jgi:heterodisulfide reductase subunit B